MVEIPESLLRRSAEAKAKALGVPVEQVLAEMKGEGPRVEVAQPEPESPVGTVAAGESVAESDVTAEHASETPVAEEAAADSSASEESPAATDAETPPDPEPENVATEVEEAPAVVATMVEDEPEASSSVSGGSSDGSGNGRTAGLVSPRPVVPPTGTPEGVRTQRLLTVVKARAIQNVKIEPVDKVSTWPHLMLMEFGALLLITAILIVMAVVIHSPLLDPANFNATPNPSKAPWYFLGLQELLSYFDPQIAGVTVPTIVGMVGFMMVPFVDKNPSTRPSDRKFAIVLYSIFLAGSATLTIIGVLFRGLGFNWAYPWVDGIFFDDLKDWVNFE